MLVQIGEILGNLCMHIKSGDPLYMITVNHRVDRSFVIVATWYKRMLQYSMILISSRVHGKVMFWHRAAAVVTILLHCSYRRTAQLWMPNFLLCSIFSSRKCVRKGEEPLAY